MTINNFRNFENTDIDIINRNIVFGLMIFELIGGKDMTTKYIRFNYFSLRLAPENQPGVSNPWDMMALLNYLAVQANELNTVIDVGEYQTEFDRDTFISQVNPEVYSFQVTKLRDQNLPPVKAIGVPREELNLAENQYLGEYITIVYDPTYCTVGVQSNIYSLNLNQIELFLTELRNRHKEAIGEIDPIPLNVELRPIVDPNKVQEIRNADIFRKITIKGSNYAAESLANQGTLNEVSQLIGQINGLNFELTLSIGNAARDISLNPEVIQEIIDSFSNLDEADERPKIEITGRLEENSKSEIVNLIEPRLTNRLRFELVGRQSLGHEIIHNTFMAEYTAIRETIARVMFVNVV